MTIQEIEQELFEMERKLKSMFNSCSQDLAIGIEKLRGELAELKESKKEGKWKPKEGETYWFINDGGETEWCVQEDGDLYDEWRYDNIPLFPTNEECERYKYFMDTVKEKSYEFPLEDWRDKVFDKYEIYYDRNLQEFIILETDNYKVFGGIYFKTHEDAQYIIDNFKEELLKYWL